MSADPNGISNSQVQWELSRRFGMKARYITNTTYHDLWWCPNCDEDMPLLPGQDQVECPHCHKQWTINFDYSFEDGRWRNCSTITERTT